MEVERLDSKVKILMAGDTHGHLGHCQYLVRTAKQEKCDRVFVLGDFGAWEHTKDGVRFFDQLDLYCNINNIKIYFVDGNHDKTSLLVEKYDETRDDEGFMIVRPYIRYAWRGHRWTWDEVRFIALGGAYSVDKEWRLDLEARYPGKYGGHGSLWFPEEEMDDYDMSQILQDTSPVDVILAHDKPRGSHPGWNRKDLAEYWPNQDRLQLAVRTLEPTLFMHGHLHYWYRQEMDYSNLAGELKNCTVWGLNCDPDAADPSRYDKSSSWWALDTEDVRKGTLY